MKTNNPLLSSDMDQAVSHFWVLRMILENNKRKKQVEMDESEKPYKFVGQPKIYYLRNECEMCGQNKTWCICPPPSSSSSSSSE